MYGYEMISTLRERSQNVFELKAGSLYPLLHNLEGKNIVASYEKEVLGKVRKYYHITKEGACIIGSETRRMERICRCCSRRHVIGGVIYMEEYFEILLEQIRCKKAHASIYHEIRGHIEEQVADNIAEDMSKDDALKAALNDMGDPVQTGVEMDQLHRRRWLGA